jgi:glucokinase
MTASAEAMLLGDVGATNARFAVLFDGVLGPINWIEVSHHPIFGEAVEKFLEMHPRNTPVIHALLAVAGPVEEQRCTFTNCPWTIDGRDMRDRFGFQSVQIVKHFEATAWSLPRLANQDFAVHGWQARGAGRPHGGARAWVGPWRCGAGSGGCRPCRRVKRRRPRHDASQLSP